MRIAFDGTTLQPRRTGVGYYSEHLLRHLAESIGPADKLSVISNRLPVTLEPLPAHVKILASNRRMVRLLWMQTTAPALIAEAEADVAHFTNGMIPLASRVPSVVTIHDMSLTLYPGCHPKRRLLLNRPLVRLAAERAAAIITPSACAKRDLVRLHGVHPDRVHVVHEAAAPEFGRVTDDAALAGVRRRYRLPARFVLHVGAIEPRKNLPRLLDAFARRHRSGDLPHHLVLVGPYGWLSRDIGRHIEALGISDAVHLAGYVPFADLPAIYSAAEMFVFPSLYEGFGLPVVEAMACGAPVVVSHADALTEIGGDAVTVVDPLDTDAIGDAMTAIGRDADRRRDLSARSLARASEFSWTRAAQDTLGVYRAVANARATAADHASIAGRPSLTDRPSPIDLRSPITHRPMKSVLLGQAYFLRFDPKLWEAQQPYPPLGTLYAAAALRAAGHDVAVFDAMLAESEQDWAAALDRERPRVAVIYEDSFNYLSKMCLLRMREAALTMIDHARSRGVTAVVSGSDATDHPDVYLDRGAACVILGEGEATLGAVVDTLVGRGAGSLADIRGLCLRAGDGRVVRTGAREFIRSLDELPRPAWDLIDVDRYRRVWRERHHTFSMNIATTRGCPYHCNWCAKPIYGQRYATRSAANVVAEMAWLKTAYGPDHLWIVDDIFGLTPGWIEEFATLAESADAVIPFKCLMRADQVTPAVVAALARARCRTVWLGAESGSQKILDAMDKGTRVSDIVDASRLLKAACIETGFFLQFGYPGETRDDIELTLQMVRECGPDDIGISISYPLPGTPFYDRVRAELGAKQNWFDSNDLATMYRATFGPEFYRVLHRAIHTEFRLRKASSLLRIARAPWSLRPRHVKQALTAAGQAAILPLLKRQLTQLSLREQKA